MSAALAQVDEENGVEDRRRSLMAQSDELLEEVEVLRLDDKESVPPSLQAAIHALQERLGRSNPPVSPSTLHAAHDLVFAVQQRLMAANPKHPRPNRHQGRPGGQPIVTRVYDGSLWKVLTLPTPPNGSADDEWLDLVDATVERAWDRWCYAQQHALRAARSRHQPRTALPGVPIASGDYWELGEEARRIRSRLGARASSTSSGDRAARVR